MRYYELRIPLFILLPVLLQSVGTRSTPLQKKCIASDGTSYSITESWIPKLHFRTHSCISCTCYEDAIVKCKKSHCSMLSCSSDGSQEKCCSHCMAKFGVTNVVERSPKPALPKPKLHKHNRKNETDTVSSMSPSRATLLPEQKRAALWRQRLIEFHEKTTTTSTPKATTPVPLSRESAVLRLSYNRQLLDEEKRQPGSTANWRLATKRMQTERRMQMSLTTYDRPTTSSRNTNNLGFGDMTQIFSVFGLLKADSATPAFQSSALPVLTPCRVQAPGEKVTKSQVYQHGDWWKTTLPILGQNTCVKCTCENGEVKCRIPKCTPRDSLPCSRPIESPGRCCASCPVVSTPRPLSFDVDSINKHSEFVFDQQKKSGCNGKFYPVIYRFIYELNKIDLELSDLKASEPKSYVIAIHQKDLVEIYNWTLGKDDRPHRRHVIRVRSSSFKRYNEMSTPGGEFQLWSATSEARIRKFKRREEKWRGSCKSSCRERMRRMVTRLLLKSPEKVKCAMLNHSDAVI